MIIINLTFRLSFNVPVPRRIERRENLKMSPRIFKHLQVTTKKIEQFLSSIENGRVLLAIPKKI